MLLRLLCLLVVCYNISVVYADDFTCSEESSYGVHPVSPFDSSEIPVSYRLSPYIYINYLDYRGICRHSNLKLYDDSITQIRGRNIIVKKSKCEPKYFYDLQLVKNKSIYFSGKKYLSSKILEAYPSCIPCAQGIQSENICEQTCYSLFTQDCLCPYLENISNHSALTSSCAPTHSQFPAPYFCTVSNVQPIIRIVPSKKSHYFNPEIKIIFKQGAQSLQKVFSTTTQKYERVIFDGNSYYIKVYFDHNNHQICATVESNCPNDTKNTCFEVPELRTPSNLSFKKTLNKDNMQVNALEFYINELQKTFIIPEGVYNDNLKIEVFSPKIENMNFVSKRKCLINHNLISEECAEQYMYESYAHDPQNNFICINILKKEKNEYVYRGFDKYGHLEEINFLPIVKKFVPVTFNQKRNLWYVDYSKGETISIQSLDEATLDAIDCVGKLNDIFSIPIGNKFIYYRYEYETPFFPIKRLGTDTDATMLFSKEQAFRFNIWASTFPIYVMPASHIDDKKGQFWFINDYMQAINLSSEEQDTIPVRPADPLSQKLCIHKEEPNQFTELSSGITPLNGICKKAKIIIYGSGSDAFINYRQEYQVGAPGEYEEIVFDIPLRSSFIRIFDDKPLAILMCDQEDNCCTLRQDAYETLESCQNITNYQYSWDEYLASHKVPDHHVGFMLINPKQEVKNDEIYSSIHIKYTECYKTKDRDRQIENDYPGSGGCYCQENKILQDGGSSKVFISCIEHHI